jgi:hypothetical protein
LRRPAGQARFDEESHVVTIVFRPIDDATAQGDEDAR